MADDANAGQQAPAPISLKEFFERTPPGQTVVVSDPVRENRRAEVYCDLVSVELELYCDNELCEGVRVFEATGTPSVRPKGWNDEFITFRCKNCEATLKRYAIVVVLDESLR